MKLQEMKASQIAAENSEVRYQVRLGTVVAGNTKIYIEMNITSTSPTLAADSAKAQVGDHLAMYQEALMRKLEVVNVTPTKKLPTQ